MFCPPSDTGFTPVLPGVSIRTLVHGPATLMTEFRLQAGSELPLHGHPHEQTGYLVSGRIRLHVGGQTLEAAPGAAWCVPAGVEHRAEILEDSVAIEVFSPCREDYLKYLVRAARDDRADDGSQLSSRAQRQDAGEVLGDRRKIVYRVSRTSHWR